MSKANIKKLAYVGSQPTAGKKRDSDSWYTPEPYIHSVRRALGGSIDLDPFSSEKANETVRASHILTQEDDAFLTDWSLTKPTTVFMNPPYSNPMCKNSISRYLDAYHFGWFEKGIVLVNNATDTQWFRALIADARMVCFTDHRIAFYNADGKSVSGNTRGQCFVLHARNVRRTKTLKDFQRAFSPHGHVMEVK